MLPDDATDWHGTSAADFQALAERYGTPYYLYDAEIVRRRIMRVRDAFHGLVQVYYAVKANPNLELLRSVRDTADGLDISSSGELEQAMLAGFDAANMSFAGPAKSAAELEAAIRAGVGCISVESMRELRDCAAVAQRTGIRANVALRVNPQLLHRAYGLKMGGRAVQFGVDEEDLPAAERALLGQAEHVVFRGIHIYAGSQGFDPAAVAEGIENTLRIVQEVEQRSGLTCAKINLGGGFGVAHGEESRELDVHSLAAGLVPTIRKFHRTSQRKVDLIFELGRYLTAEAGIYVTRVISTKVSRGKAFYACDGGLHHHLAAAGTFGAALRSNFALRNLTRPKAPRVVCNICGPSCNPTDLLGVEANLSQPVEGDLIGVLKSGSYGLTASPILFLGRQTPPELVRRDGQVVLGRKSFKVTDIN